MAQMYEFINKVGESNVNRRRLFCDVFGISETELDDLADFGLVPIDTPQEILMRQWERMHSLQFESFVANWLSELTCLYPPSVPGTVNLFILDESDDFGRQKLGGVSAYTDYDGAMVFIVYPDEISRPFLRSTVAHEYSHHLRIQALGLTEHSETLLDKMISEGLAEHFVSETLGDEFLRPWVEALSSEAAWSTWKTQYAQHPSQTGKLATPYLFGSEELGLPLWAGYSMGYHLVSWYRKQHPDLSMEEFMLLDAGVFVPRW